ncbi:hypothetical protein OIO90_002125 [Microbotryomycetes sp. JL221]|nr:hypothetical protein OIO90_002125 [Microbotryomycetes sp. JL221]
MSSADRTGPLALKTAKELLQRVTRMFYGVKQTILIDQLVRKEAFRDDDISARMVLPHKEVAKIVQKLVEDQLVFVHRRAELREGAPKATNRNYYYINYAHATDVIKWRIFRIQQTVDDRLRNELDAQGFVCPQCKKRFTHLDAGILQDPFRNFGLFCDVCGAEVIDNENEAEVKGSKDRMQRLNEQTRVIVDLLKKTDEFVLPKFDVEAWLQVNGPQGSTAVASTEDKTGQSQPAFSIQLAGDEDEAAERIRREQEAEAKRQQNQLPSWIAQSTISGEQANTEQRRTSDQLERLETKPTIVNGDAPTTNATNGVDNVASPSKDVGDDLDAYFASLQQDSVFDSGAGSTVDSPAFDNGDNGSTTRPHSAVGSPAIALDFKRQASSAPSHDDDDDDFVDAVVNDIESTTKSSKRSREESEPATPAQDADNASLEKKARLDDESEPATATATATVSQIPADEFDDDDDEDDFEEVDEQDSNPMIPVGDKLVPFKDIDEAIQAAMTPEEYTAYWDVFQRLG